MTRFFDDLLDELEAKSNSLTTSQKVDKIIEWLRGGGVAPIPYEFLNKEAKVELLRIIELGLKK